MQAAAARAGASRMQPVLRGLAVAAGQAARIAVSAVGRFARRRAVAYVTGEITLADILMYLTSTFEDEEPVPAPDPHIGERVVTAVFSGMVVVGGVVLVGMSIADVVEERSRRTRKQKSYCDPYAPMGQCMYRTSSSRDEAPAPATAPQRRAIGPFTPTPRRAVAPFDARHAITAWLHECEAAGIKHQRK